jgi:hypothetical protein
MSFGPIMTFERQRVGAGGRTGFRSAGSLLMRTAPSTSLRPAAEIHPPETMNGDIDAKGG